MSMDLWDYRKNFDYDRPLESGDPLRVDLNAARGDYNRGRLLRELGVDLAKNELRHPRVAKCILFGGHRGCGKTTELRAVANDLHNPKRFFVIHIDALKELDVNNLNYADVALAFAQLLAEKLVAEGIVVPDQYLSQLHEWFQQISRSQTFESNLKAEIETGITAKLGLPFIGQMFARLKASIRSNTTYKTEIREQVRNSITALTEAFNTLHDYAQDALAEAGKGRAVIFIVDGTDRMRSDEAVTFFVSDIHQLRLLRTNCIYCAPINVLNEQGQVAQNFDAIFRLPMVKLTEKGMEQPIDLALQCMRSFIDQRLPRENFDSPDTLDLLIKNSGGHPRDLLRLVNFCFQELDQGPITHTVAQTAVRRLANDYKRLIKLDPDDFTVLVQIDKGDKTYTPATDQTRRLLYDLVLLEYNSYWWQSHPAVRSLEGYVAATVSMKPPAGYVSGV
ncbi:MAG: hypothetical protein WAZ34_00335 [Rhodocyclaceae bacterium]